MTLQKGHPSPRGDDLFTFKGVNLRQQIKPSLTNIKQHRLRITDNTTGRLTDNSFQKGWDNMSYQIHTVRPGDTLASIARHYGVTMQQLRKLNVHLTQSSGSIPRTSAGSKIYVGDEVRIKELLECGRNVGPFQLGCRYASSDTLKLEFGIKGDVSTQPLNSSIMVGARITFSGGN